MWQYMPKAAQARIARLIADAAEDPRAAPLAWLRLEAMDERVRRDSSDVMAGWTRARISRASFHSYWAEWAPR